MSVRITPGALDALAINALSHGNAFASAAHGPDAEGYYTIEIDSEVAAKLEGAGVDPRDPIELSTWIREHA